MGGLAYCAMRRTHPPHRRDHRRRNGTERPRLLPVPPHLRRDRPHRGDYEVPLRRGVARSPEQACGWPFPPLQQVTSYPLTKPTATRSLRRAYSPPRAREPVFLPEQSASPMQPLKPHSGGKRHERVGGSTAGPGWCGRAAALPGDHEADDLRWPDQRLVGIGGADEQRNP